ncbi:MAG: OmpA family protein [Candidatus Desulforudis sp.]|nr:OmpA family protein [Desulforudis sp.]
MKRLGRHGGSGHGGTRERWVLPYADFMTVLLCFFIVMYSLSSVDAEKFAALARALQHSLGGRGSVLIEAPDAAIGPDERFPFEIDRGISKVHDATYLAQIASVQQQVQELMDEVGLTGQVEMKVEERGLVISVQDTVLFATGSAELTSLAREIMDKLGLIILQTPNYIRIEGHTDNVPINTPRFPSNWELSAARSTSVVQYLIARHNFPPERLSATGYGEYRPKAANTTPDGRQKNRRVDFVILSSTFEMVEPETMR